MLCRQLQQIAPELQYNNTTAHINSARFYFPRAVHGLYKHLASD